MVPSEPAATAMGFCGLEHSAAEQALGEVLGMPGHTHGYLALSTAQEPYWFVDGGGYI